MSQIPPPCDVTKCDIISHFVMLAGEFAWSRDVTCVMLRHLGDIFEKCRLGDITCHIVTKRDVTSRRRHL